MVVSSSCSVHITKPTVGRWTTRGLNDTQLPERDRVRPVGQPGAGLADVLQAAVVASLASARRRDKLTCCDVQLST